jgi:hypothetical protein
MPCPIDIAGNDMSGFVLVDLSTQHNEVVKYVEGMTENEVIEWLKVYGDVVKISSPYDSKLYYFRSNAGVQTGFRFDENEK